MFSKSINKIAKSLCNVLFVSIFIISMFSHKAHANIATSLGDFSNALEVIFKKEKITFIQIGSNDGILADPLSSLIRKHKWRGVLVEPLPHLFEKLKKNYSDVPNLIFENVAITNTRGTLDFYTIDVNTEWYKTQSPIWADQLGSFYPDHIFNHFGKDAPVIQVEVPCITIQDLVDKHQISNVDLIHMDTEGHDSTIILSIDFNKIKPKAILFEQGHSYRDPQKFIDCLEHLSSNGYKIFMENHVDMLLIREDLL